MKLSLILVSFVFTIKSLVSEVVITPNTPGDPDAILLLLANDPYATVTDDGSQWKIYQGTGEAVWDDWALSVTLAAEVYGFIPGAESKVTITVAGSAVLGDCDGFFGFGIGGEYVTFSTNLDTSGFGIGNMGSGSFIYPACADGVATGDVSTLITASLGNLADLRNDLAAGDETKFSKIKSGANGSPWPFRFELTNNDVDGTFTVRYVTGNNDDYDINCVYPGAVATGEEIKMFFQLDYHGETVFLDSVTVDGVNTGFAYKYELIQGANVEDAEGLCQDTFGTNGASVHNQGEFNTLYRMCQEQLINLGGAQICCLGGDDLETEGEWLWNDGSGDFSPSADNAWLWAEGQPNSGVANPDYACIATSGGQHSWNFGLHDCVSGHLCYAICNAPVTNCEDAEPGTFNWDELTADGTDEPEHTHTMVAGDDLILHIHVELEYLGKTSADHNGAVYGTTYVLDFEDFSAHQHDLSAPGTCENRKSKSFTGAFSEWWGYDELKTREERQVGTDAYLAYPPTDTDKWEISMKADDDCGTVVYDGEFTWNELVGCNDGAVNSDSYVTTVSDDLWLNLTGVFYINVVSPYDFDTSDQGKYYRVYQLLSQPFVIAVSRSVYVLGEVGIDLMTMSVIAVYKEDKENRFRLIVLTESSDYLQLDVDTGTFLFQPDAGVTVITGDFLPAGEAVTKDDSPTGGIKGCLNNKAYICSQLWEITAEDVNCEGNTKFTDFSGIYSLQFATSCRTVDGNAEITPELETHCNDWLGAHQAIVGGVTLDAKLTWKDTVCDPEIFTTQFEATMQFYTDDAYLSEAADDKLYKVGDDEIYVQITTNYPEDTYSVFETELIQVWICTFDPLIVVPPADPDQFTGGCFSGYDETGYEHKIYENTVPVYEREGFVLDGHPPDGATRILRFHFTVPNKIQRDTLYVHAQIEVSLTNGRRRRILLTTYAESVASQMQHFVGHTGVDYTQKPQPQPQQHNYEQPNYQQPQQPNYGPPPAEPSPFVVSLSSSWIIVIGGLLAIVLVFNIVFMCYMNCNQGQRQGRRGSLNRRRRSGYASVKNVDSEEFHDSEVNAINVASE